jgi:hypothetical protein
MEATPQRCHYITIQVRRSKLRRGGANGCSTDPNPHDVLYLNGRILWPQKQHPSTSGEILFHFRNEWHVGDCPSGGTTVIANVGQDHLDVATILSNIGDVHLAQRGMEDARH